MLSAIILCICMMFCSFIGSVLGSFYVWNRNNRDEETRAWVHKHELENKAYDQGKLIPLEYRR